MIVRSWNHSRSLKQEYLSGREQKSLEALNKKVIVRTTGEITQTSKYRHQSMYQTLGKWNWEKH